MVSKPSLTGMRTHVLFLSASLVSCTSARTPKTAPTIPPTPSREYAGVYVSTPDEDYFTPCGIDGAGDSWTLRFRDDESQAPFLKKVSAIRGLPPLTHFIRIRGRLGPTGSFNGGFQTRELAVDSVLDVKESLEPCRGFGAPAGWSGFRERFRRPLAIALSTDRRLVALMDNKGQISIRSTGSGELIRKLASPAKGDLNSPHVQIVFSDDGQLLAVGGFDGIVRVWRPRAGKKVFSLALKDSAAVARETAKIPPPPDAQSVWRPAPSNRYTPVQQMVFNKPGTMLATTNLFSSIVWSMKTGKKLAEFKIGNDFRRRIFFVEDERLLVTADSGRTTLRYLDARRPVLTGIRAAETDHLVMSPDGRTIAVGSWGDSVLLASVAEGTGPVLHVSGFLTGVTAFSPDGNTIAIAGGMHGLYLYDVRTGAPMRAFHNFPGPLSGAWFSTDGKAIVTLSTFDDRFRIVYVDSTARPAGENIFDDSLTAELPLGPPSSTSPRTIGGNVTGPNQRAVAGAEVSISNGDTPDFVIARTTTSPGGYFSFNGIRFRHVVIRVQKSGFAPAVKYIHTNNRDIDGPWGIELKPETRTAQ